METEIILSFRTYLLEEHGHMNFLAGVTALCVSLTHYHLKNM